MTEQQINDNLHSFTKLDSLYRKLKTIDEYTLNLVEQNETTDINRAMLGYIASFGLSMIKDIYLKNTNSAGFYFSIRALLEGIAVDYYRTKYEVSEKENDIFKLQSYYLEKRIYERYPKLDQKVYDLLAIRQNFKEVKNYVVTKHKLTANDLKIIFASKVPALGNIRSFESLIRANLPQDYLQLYKIISLFAHPYNYRLRDDEIILGYTNMLLEALEIMFEDVPEAEVGLVYEYNRTIGLNEYGSNVRALTHLQSEKLTKLEAMLEDLGYEFLALTINTCKGILFDYFLDISLGYTEQSTTKWKSAIESLWMLNLCLSDEEVAKEHALIYYHTRIKEQLNLEIKVSDEEFKPAYEIYKNKYPKGCDFKKFTKAFRSTTGYTINEQGKIISLRKGVFALIDELSPLISDGKMATIIKNDEYTPLSTKDYQNTIEIDINSFLKMKYDESQAMSHANGYLYLALAGAWFDGTVLAYLYDELFQVLLGKLLTNLKTTYKHTQKDKQVINFLRNFMKDNTTYILKKKTIYLMPRVRKDY